MKSHSAAASNANTTPAPRATVQPNCANNSAVNGVPKMPARLPPAERCAVHVRLPSANAKSASFERYRTSLREHLGFRLRCSKCGAMPSTEPRCARTGSFHSTHRPRCPVRRASSTVIVTHRNTSQSAAAGSPDGLLSLRMCRSLVTSASATVTVTHFCTSQTVLFGPEYSRGVPGNGRHRVHEALSPALPGSQLASHHRSSRLSLHSNVTHDLERCGTQ